MWTSIWHHNPGFDSPADIYCSSPGFEVFKCSVGTTFFRPEKSVSPSRYICTPKLSGVGYCTYTSKCHRKEYLVGHLHQSNTFLLRG